jgi:N-acetylmuramoyl-L-alanine amidase
MRSDRPSIRRPSRLWLVAGATLLTLVAVIGGVAAEDRHRRVEFDLAPHGTLRWERGERPVLQVLPRRGDGWEHLSRRYCGTAAEVSGIRARNAPLRAPQLGRRVVIPVELLRADLRLQAVKTLFPIDDRLEEGWRHFILDPFGDGSESLEWLGHLFTGVAGRAELVGRANAEVVDAGMPRGRTILIPQRHLLPVFRDYPVTAATPTPTPSPRPTPRSTPTVAAPPTVTSATAIGAPVQGALSFGVDSDGEFAVYRLRRGEALYSAVVVRFTGRLRAEFVNQTAMDIAERSGIRDVTDIPVGYPVKIPFDLLLPEYLPADHPRRIAWERQEAELARFLEVVRASDLSGVHVILDAGHGGRDSGTATHGVWESTYVYDIMCRVREILNRHTRATVWTTIRDQSRHYGIPDSDRLSQDRDQVLMTTPPYPLEDSAVGVHLRWYLTNDIILDRIPKDVPRSKVVFVSIHADSLHPSVRGAMVYVAARSLRDSSPQLNHRAMKKHEEYRDHPTVRISGDFAARSEASSRYMAGRIIESLVRNEIAVHPNKPVRDRIFRARGRGAWVPAVLRYSSPRTRCWWSVPIWPTPKTGPTWSTRSGASNSLWPWWRVSWTRSARLSTANEASATDPLRTRRAAAKAAEDAKGISGGRRGHGPVPPCVRCRCIAPFCGSPAPM